MSVTNKERAPRDGVMVDDMTFKKLNNITKREIFKTEYNGDVFVIELEYHFNVDIYEAWMYKQNYGVKESIFGWPRVQHDKVWTFNDFKKLVFDNLSDGGYFDYYNEQYI